MQVPISDLVNISDATLFKLIISSADKFPGLYRMSSSWEQSISDTRFMKWMNFFETICLTEKGRLWSKSQWLSVQEHIFEFAYGANSRNDQRNEDDLKEILKRKAKNWFSTAKSIRLAVIDSYSDVFSITCGETYYVMGSLIRFEENAVHIAYDQVTQTSFLKINISYNEAISYIQEVFSKESLNELFHKAEVIAHLHFDEALSGHLVFDKNALEFNFNSYLPQSPIFGSVIYDRSLPIQYAKPIGITNVSKFLE